MDVTEIQQIGEIITSLGEDARYAFIWYLCTTYGVSLVKFVLGMGVLFYTVRNLFNVVYSFIKQCSQQDKIMRAAGFERNSDKCYYESDVDRVIERLKPQ